jgi:hypothetical protein
VAAYDIGLLSDQHVLVEDAGTPVILLAGGEADEEADLATIGL